MPTQGNESSGDGWMMAPNADVHNAIGQNGKFLSLIFYHSKKV